MLLGCRPGLVSCRPSLAGLSSSRTRHSHQRGGGECRAPPPPAAWSGNGTHRPQALPVGQKCITSIAQGKGGTKPRRGGHKMAEAAPPNHREGRAGAQVKGRCSGPRAVDQEGGRWLSPISLYLVTPPATPLLRWWWWPIQGRNGACHRTRGRLSSEGCCALKEVSREMKVGPAPRSGGRFLLPS